VHEVTVDIDERRAVGFLVHDMAIPDLVVKRATHLPLSETANYRTPIAA
jgi:hypothetical protein